MIVIHNYYFAIVGTGRGFRGPSPRVTKEALKKMFEINSLAPLLVVQNFVPLMGKRIGRVLSSLVFLSSKVGSVDDSGSGGAYAYQSSKSALNNIVKSLSMDLQDDICVVLLHPGYVKTDMTGGKGFHQFEIFCEWDIKCDRSYRWECRSQVCRFKGTFDSLVITRKVIIFSTFKKCIYKHPCN